MDYLAKNAQLVPADFKGPIRTGFNSVAVTFDDGFASLAETAIPEMESRGIPFTVFVPSAFVGRPAGWIRNPRNNKSLPHVMDTRQIQELERIPKACIGSHCRTHRRLTELQDPESKEEITRSKKELEEILGCGVTLLSFPHGSYRENHLVMAGEAGYQRVFTIEPIRNNGVNGGVFPTGRIRVDPGDWNRIPANKWLRPVGDNRFTDKEDDLPTRRSPTLSGPYDVRIDGLTDSDWDTVLEEFKDVSVYQTWAYGSVSWGEKNLSHVVLRSRDGKIVAASQARIVHIPVFGGGVAYIPWGPMWREQGEDLESFRAILRAMKSEYVTKRKLLLRVRPREVAGGDGGGGHAILTDEGFRKNENVSPYRTFLLDLSPEMPDLIKHMDAKWRNQLRQAMKNPLLIAEGTSDEMFETFIALSSEMLQRKKFTPGVEFDSFRKIQKALPPERKMRIFICEVSGKPLAVAICSAHGDTGIYLLGATGNQGREFKRG